jgi:uncharacterized RDD family membrane protein YckC
MKHAGFWKRFLAYNTDALIIVIASITISFLFGQNPFGGIHANSYEDLVSYNQSASGYYTLAVFLFWFLYYCLFLVYGKGQTLGRKLMAIQVIRENKKPVGWADVVVRFFSSFISAFVFFLGYLWVAFDTNKQAWHDKIANTYVVETKQKPKTVLASIVVVLFLVTYISFTSFAFAKAIMLGYEHGKSEHVKTQKTSGKSAGGSDAGAVLEESNKIFSQIKSSSTKEEAVELADKNILLLRQATIDYPNDAVVWRFYGDAMTWSNTVVADYNEVFNAYKTAYGIDANDYHSARSLGDIYVDTGEYEMAVKAYKDSIRANSDKNPQAYYGLGRAYSGLKLQSEVEANMQKAIEQFEADNSDGKWDTYIIEAQKLKSGNYTIIAPNN